MTVKNIETREVHKGQRGGKTGCGVDTRKNPDHWVTTSERITCDKDGCKN